VIGMVGLLPDARSAGALGFARTGEEIALVGPFAPSLGASELSKLRGEPLPDGLAEFEIDAVRAAQAAVREAVRDGALSSAHDIAEGGVAIALAECCLAGGLGADVELATDGPAATDVAMFGEGPGGFIVSGEPAALRALGEHVSVRRLGTVGGEGLTIVLAVGDGAGEPVALSLEQLAHAHASMAELFA
jgi:phosphoribosylformylglycinamidine synthase